MCVLDAFVSLHNYIAADLGGMYTRLTDIYQSIRGKMCYDLASSDYSCESYTWLLACPVIQLIYIIGLFIFCSHCDGNIAFINWEHWKNIWIKSHTLFKYIMESGVMYIWFNFAPLGNILTISTHLLLYRLSINGEDVVYVHEQFNANNWDETISASSMT